MEYIYFFLFLLYIISASSLIIPNSDINSRSKRPALRSSDPLTRRSSAEKNFIRFGRSTIHRNARFLKNPTQISFETTSKHKNNLNKREALHYINENADLEFILGAADVDTNLNRPQESLFENSNLMCLIPDETSSDRMLCMQPGKNASNNYYVITEREEELPSSNQTDIFHRHFRSSEESDRIRKSKSGNFIRLGRSKFNMFSRYDRGRDNFMRLGRSSSADVSNEKRKHDSFIRLGRVSIEDNKSLEDDKWRQDRVSDDTFDRYSRRNDNFMRLGRVEPTYSRYSRKYDNFMRFGQIPDKALNRLVNKQNKRKESTTQVDQLPGENFERLIRRHDNFIRLGRSPSENIDCTVQLQNYITKVDRSSDDGLDRSVRLHGNAVKLSRQPDDSLGKMKLKCHDDFTKSGESLFQIADQIVASKSVGCKEFSQKYANTLNRENKFKRLGTDTEERPFDEDANLKVIPCIQLGGHSGNKNSNSFNKKSMLRIPGRFQGNTYDQFLRRTENIMRDLDEPTIWISGDGSYANPGERLNSVTRLNSHTRTIRSTDKNRMSEYVINKQKQSRQKINSNIKSGNSVVELTKSECFDLSKDLQINKVKSVSAKENNVNFSNSTDRTWGYCMEKYGFSLSNKKSEHIKKVEHKANSNIHNVFARKILGYDFYLKSGLSNNFRTHKMDEKCVGYQCIESSKRTITSSN